MEQKATSIVIEILDQDGQVIAQKESLLWLSAQEDLFKLERFLQRKKIPSSLGKTIYE